MYVFYEPNEKVRKRGHSDCVLRAFTKATGKTWLEVFDELVPIARKKQAILNEKCVYEQFLKQNNFIKISNKVEKGSKRLTVSEFTKVNPVGTYVLVLANHLVTVVDGNYYDRWDCGYKPVYTFWKKGS